MAEPLAVYRVLRESGVYSRLDVAQTRGLTPLVGREQEVGLLLERWAQVKDGHGHVVLLTGDAGIGKSRLVQRLKEHVAHEPHLRWECRSLQYYQNTALYPLTDLFQRTLQWQPDETPDEKFGKLEQTLSQYRLPLEATVPLFAPLLSLPVPENRYPLLNLSPQRQRQKTLETIVALLLEQAEQHPVLFIVEDLHWIDPSTLELLNLVLDQTPTASVLVLLTCRPHFQPAWHHRSYLTEITVNRLSHTQVEQIVTGVTHRKTFPTEVLQQIIAKTDGVPLFVEELTKAILESGHLKDVNGHYELVGSFATFAIPATLQDSLMARLDRLMTGKVIAQLGAAIGRQFAYDLLHVVSQLDEVTLQRELSRLVEAEIVYQRGVPPQSTYVFKHALIQDAAYESLLKSTQQQYHQRIAQVLEAQFSETAAAQPELLAHHYTEAGLTEQAVHSWQEAGKSAGERSAHAEAIRHLTTGLDLLQTLPETPERTQRQVDMYIALGASLIAMEGYGAPEVAQTFTRARQLCQHLADLQRLFPVLRGLWSYYTTRAELQQERAEATISLAKEQRFPFVMAFCSMLLGWALAHQAQGKEGIEQMHTVMRIGRAKRAMLGQPYWLALLAEAYGIQGEPEASLTVLTEALRSAEITGERWYVPELYRQKGTFLLNLPSDNQAEAETCFAKAITIAQNQSAKSLELRAATSLAKLWQRQGKRHEAYDLLSPVYSWFTEGFDTADLKDAKTLLDALEKRR